MLLLDFERLDLSVGDRCLTLDASLILRVGDRCLTLDASLILRVGDRCLTLDASLILRVYRLMVDCERLVFDV
jgi:hypothetical protein